MCRSESTSTCLALLGALLSALAVPGGANAAGADGGGAVEAFLDRHGLTDLLATHLEEELEQAEGEIRKEIADRLAVLYAEMLQQAVERDDQAERKRLEQRSRRLLDETEEGAAGASGAGAAEELRLALLRVRYRTAERLAEDHRLRRASEEDLEQAESLFAELVPELQMLARQMQRAINLGERRLNRASGAEASAISSRLDHLSQLHGEARFLAGWSLYYLSWLRQVSDHARVAEPIFAELLLADATRPQPEQISRDLRAHEPFARAILGMALCRSLTSSLATALRWVDLLEEEPTAAALREQAAMWRLLVLLEHGEFRSAEQLLRSLLDERAEASVPTGWLRLAAVHAIEMRRGGPQARPAARAVLESAVAEIADRGDLSQIHQLAERYGAEALGGSGFALRYVTGLLVYQEARQRHDDDQPLRWTSDRRAEPASATSEEEDLEPRRKAEAAALYEQAIDEFRAALRESDAGRHEQAASTVRRLIAWALHFQGRFAEATDAFLAAEADSPPDEAAEMLWMAIVCINRLLDDEHEPREARPDHSARLAQRAELVERFLATWPAHPQANWLVVQRAAREARSTRTGPGTGLPDAMLDDLLRVPADHPAYESARWQAADALYYLFRDLRRGHVDRGEAAQRFLAVASPLLDARWDDDDEGGRERMMAHARRVLEVSLSSAAERLGPAERALDVLSRMQRQHDADERLSDELDYRRAQVTLLRGDIEASALLADDLWDRDPTSTYARQAALLIFQHAWEASRDGLPDLDSRPRAQADSRLPRAAGELLRLVVRHGGRVLREHDDDAAAGALVRPHVAAVTAAVAEASVMLWRAGESRERGEAALFLYERLLEAHPRQARFLHPAAVLAEAFERDEFALDCWRRLAAGLPSGSDEWFEARFHQIALLARLDPERARTVLGQHRALYPEYGPEPWNERFAVVERRLAMNTDAKD